MLQRRSNAQKEGRKAVGFKKEPITGIKIIPFEAKYKKNEETREERFNELQKNRRIEIIDIDNTNSDKEPNLNAKPIKSGFKAGKNINLNGDKKAKPDIEVRTEEPETNIPRYLDIMNDAAKNRTKMN